MTDLPIRARDGLWVTLTPAQVTLIEQVMAGMSSKEIARDLSVTRGTVTRRLRTLYSTLAVGNRTELAVLYFVRRSHRQEDEHD